MSFFSTEGGGLRQVLNSNSIYFALLSELIAQGLHNDIHSLVVLFPTFSRETALK